MQNHLKINPNFIIEEIEDVISIIDPINSYILSFNNTGTFIFKLLQKNYSTKYISRELHSKFELSEETARKDIQQFIVQLQKAHVFL